MENPRSTSPSPYCHNYTSTDSVWNRPAEIQAICVPSSATVNRRSEGIGSACPPMKILQAAALVCVHQCLEAARRRHSAVALEAARRRPVGAAPPASFSVPGLFDECRDVGVQGLQIRFMGIDH